MPDVADAFRSLTIPALRDDIVKPQGGFVKPTMGSIRERVRKDGTTGYTAQIILKRKGKDTYREAATFDRRTQAAAWLKSREAELKEPGGIERAKVRGATVADAIDHYIQESVRDLGRTKSQVLRTIKTYPLASQRCEEITSADIVEFAKALGERMQPQTVDNYLSHLTPIFELAKPAWKIPLDPTAMSDARKVLRALGSIEKSHKRERRPTIEEIDKLINFFMERTEREPESAPMERIIPFAMFSTRRQGEIVRIMWEDFDHDRKRILVRDMKHPKKRAGNNVWCDLPDAAIPFMGEAGKGRIFPYTEDAISAAFTRACYVLGINDKDMPDKDRLHFHDLRHEGVSRLFEMGWEIPRVALVSGHRSWHSLQRYTQMKQTGDKWAGWKWLPPTPSSGDTE